MPPDNIQLFPPFNNSAQSFFHPSASLLRQTANFQPLTASIHGALKEFQQLLRQAILQVANPVVKTTTGLGTYLADGQSGLIMVDGSEPAHGFAFFGRGCGKLAKIFARHSLDAIQFIGCQLKARESFFRIGEQRFSELGITHGTR
jgi:hypothetical protein